MKIISIHQPTYLPWLGFFKKISSSDVFVFLDDVQYEKNGFQNRNKIRTDEGENWLTVPITGKFGTLLKDIQIDNSSNWSKKHSKSIVQNYTKAKYFHEYWNEFESIYERKFEFLIDLNVEIIKLIMKKLNNYYCQLNILTPLEETRLIMVMFLIMNWQYSMKNHMFF